MANNPLDTALVDKAIKFAVEAHAGTERRGKGYPYVIHVLEAAEIVASMTSDPHMIAAAVLHDTVEDTEATLEDIRREFGDRVASLVDTETERAIPTSGSESDTWIERKKIGIKILKEASLDAKMVAMGDKLSNMRAIARDYWQKGDALWSIFHAPGGKKDIEWRYRALADALKELDGTAAYKEFCMLIDATFGKEQDK